MDLRATISADIVGSTSLSVDSMLSLNESIKSCIADIEEHFPGTWGRLVKGDSIEFVVDSPRMALRIALILKAYVKSLSLEKSPEAEQFRRSAIRLAIGIGPMRLIDKEKDFMDGEAIYLSGRAISNNRKSKDFFKIVGKPTDIHPEINIMASLTNNLINHSRWRPCKVLYYKLLKYSQKEIATEIDRSESAVSQALSAIGWEAINSFIVYFEDLNF